MDRLDFKRHAPTALRRRQARPAGNRGPQALALSGRVRRRAGNLFTDDTTPPERGGRFRWLMSTLLAGAVGTIAIVVVVAGAFDPQKQSGGQSASWRQVFASLWREPQDQAARVPRARTVQPQGLAWSIPKTDKLQLVSDAYSMRALISETMRERRDNRDYLKARSYVRISARLQAATSRVAQQIPAFNPYLLYTNQDEQGAAADPTQRGQRDMVQSLEALPIGPSLVEDGYEIASAEAVDLLQKFLAIDEQERLAASQAPSATALPTGPAAMRGGFAPDGSERGAAQALFAERTQRAGPEPLPPNTTALAKNVIEAEEFAEDGEARDVRIYRVTRGDTLTRLITRAGGETWQARAMVEAARQVLPDTGLASNQEVHITVTPSTTRPGRVEPVRLSVFGENQDHRLTIAKNAANEYFASAAPIDERAGRGGATTDDQAPTASLYAALYQAGLSQTLPPDLMLSILRIHAYETDFRRKVRGSDSLELFFEGKDDAGLEAPLGELLMTSLTTGGETHKFYRFRSPDGVLDYYDEGGNTSRKFLMRRPIRGDVVRLTSGFGIRRHPLRGIMAMHSGVDWAGPIGTPIMAAGNGVVEYARYNFAYGNLVRIAHANGYRTSYAHLSRFASGISEGVRVRQGQVIGLLGNTGQSSGPHLHYEVSVNSQAVDPMSIQVPRDRRLTGRQLADFQRERARIDSLLRRTPVKIQEVTTMPELAQVPTR
jgi:murein DD-endopeptidase MepM/ murein hydrolase activator NlpD